MSGFMDAYLDRLESRLWRSHHWHLRLLASCYGVDEAGWPLRDDPEAP